MRKYITPKITGVVLDPKQAIIQVCQVGGVFLDETKGDYLCLGAGSGVWNCGYTKKGGAGGTGATGTNSPLSYSFAS